MICLFLLIPEKPGFMHKYTPRSPFPELIDTKASNRCYISICDYIRCILLHCVVYKLARHCYTILFHYTLLLYTLLLCCTLLSFTTTIALYQTFHHTFLLWFEYMFSHLITSIDFFINCFLPFWKMIICSFQLQSPLQIEWSALVFKNYVLFLLFPRLLYNT